MLDRMSSRTSVSSRPRRGALAALILAIAASLVLAGCGGGDKKSDKEPDSNPTEGGTQLAALWPLTGLPAPAETPKHPVVVVKIAASPSSLAWTP